VAGERLWFGYGARRTAGETDFPGFVGHAAARVVDGSVVNIGESLSMTPARMHRLTPAGGRRPTPRVTR